MEGKPSSEQVDAIILASHVETTYDASRGSETSEEDGYQMTKVTYLAITALYWSWATVICTNTSTTTIAHQVADVGGIALLAWISNATLVVQAALQTICGSLGDHYGKRWVIIIGSLIGVAGGIIAGRAHSIGQIIAGQVLFGISCSTNLLGIPAAQEIVPSRYRPLATAGNQTLIVVLCCAVQLATGATVKYNVGGDGQGWRWSYYLPAILNGVNVLLNFFFYHPPPTRIQRKEGAVAFFRSLDLPGFSLSIAGLVLLTMGLVWGGNMYTWDSAHTLASLIVGIVILIIFGLYAWKGTNRGLLDHRLFGNRNFAILLAVAFVDGLLLFGILSFLPQEVAAVFTNDAVLQVLPVVGYTITTGIGGLSAGAFLFLTKRYRIVLSMSLLWMAIFIGMLALVKKDRSWMIYAWPTLVGLGVGVTTTLPSILTSLSVPDYLIGTAVTLSGTARTVGGVIGVTIFSSVYNNKYNKFAPAHISDTALKAGLLPRDLGSILKATFSHNVTALEMIPNMSPSALGAILLASEESSLYGYKYVYITIFPFCLFCAGMIIFLKSVDENMTGHVESQLEMKVVDDKMSSSMEV